MAGFAIDLCDVIGMGIFLDVGVAVVALQAAVNVGAKLVSINGDAVAGGILHGFIAVTGKAFGLRSKVQRHKEECQDDETEACNPVMTNESDEIRQPLDWTDKNGKKRSETCGSGHALVFLHVA